MSESTQKKFVVMAAKGNTRVSFTVNEETIAKAQKAGLREVKTVFKDSKEVTDFDSFHIEELIGNGNCCS